MFVTPAATAGMVWTWRRHFARVSDQFRRYLMRQPAE
jgi:hypothetical protein